MNLSSIAFVAAAALAFTGQAFAQDYQTAAIGGPGGAPFSMRCAQGDYLVGLRVRAGDWVDAVAPLCARWDVRTQDFLAPGAGGLRGGNGGELQEQTCERRTAINSILVERAPTRLANVATLAGYCASVQTLRSNDWVVFGTTANERDARAQGMGTSFRLEPSLSGREECREGDFAVGIHGAAGSYVDRIGLICGPRPVRTNRARTEPSAPISNDPPSREEASAGANVRITPHRQRHVPTCLTGFVWREAREGDVVCVTPESRTLVRQENAAAASRVSPGGGAYGPHTCISGFVWREAFDGDVVCVTPERRSIVLEENRTAASRTNPPPGP